MCTRKALIKIDIQGRNDVFLMSEYDSQKNLTLKVLDIKENESFVGQASALDLRTQAARIRLTFRDYLDQVLKALFQNSVEKCKYIYSLEKGENYVFKWKSIDQEETVINLGSVEMTKQDHVSVLEKVLLCLAKEVVELNLKEEKYVIDLAECKNQTANALSQLSEAIDIKENLEKEMFAKFVLVLNEKKRMLKKQQSFSHKQSNSANHEAPKIKKSKLHAVSDSSEDEADEFQDVNRAGPSSSKKRNSLLFSDDDEDESVVPVRQGKIRNRKVGNKRPSTEKVVITTKNELDSRNVISDDSDDFLIENL